MRFVLRRLLPVAALTILLLGAVSWASATHALSLPSHGSVIADLPFPPPTEGGGGHLIADLPFPPPTEGGGGHLLADLPFPPPTEGGGGHLA